jgi:hypothetical protein
MIVCKGRCPSIVNVEGIGPSLSSHSDLRSCVTNRVTTTPNLGDTAQS